MEEREGFRAEDGETAEIREKNGARQKIKRTVLLCALSVMLLFSAAVTFSPVGVLPSWKQIYLFFGVGEAADRAMEAYPVTVQFLDVGKADSILITCEGKAMLVDAGDVSPTPAVAEYLTRRGIRKLDLLVATHPDNDHIGQMAQVLSRFAAGAFWMPALPEGKELISPSYKDMIRILSEAGVKPHTPAPGEMFSLGALQVEVLGPVKTYEDSNNNSIVLRLTYGEVSFLLMGDAGEQAEKDLLASGQNLSADVLKVGHHGSKTSTGKAFLSQVNPQYAVISAGEDRNNLPKDETLKRIYDVQAGIYRTDFDGTITAATDGERLEFYTAQ